jgi:hypothetical protein
VPQELGVVVLADQAVGGELQAGGGGHEAGAAPVGDQLRRVARPGVDQQLARLLRLQAHAQRQRHREPPALADVDQQRLAGARLDRGAPHGEQVEQRIGHAGELRLDDQVPAAVDPGRDLGQPARLERLAARGHQQRPAGRERVELGQRAHLVGLQLHPLGEALRGEVRSEVRSQPYLVRRTDALPVGHALEIVVEPGRAERGQQDQPAGEEQAGSHANDTR